MRSDIIEVFDLQAACKRTASERKSAGGGVLAVKTKGTANDEGQIGGGRLWRE